MPSKKTPKKQPSIRERALKLLQDPDFFGKVREAVERGGLVGDLCECDFCTPRKADQHHREGRQLRWEEFPRFASSAVDTRDCDARNYQLFTYRVELFGRGFPTQDCLPPRAQRRRWSCAPRSPTDQ